MSNHTVSFNYEDLWAIVQAQEIIYLRAMWKAMEPYVDEHIDPDEVPPPPDPPPGVRGVIPIEPMRSTITKLNELHTLRARYVPRVHVDPDFAKAVANICRENAELVEGLAQAEQQA